MMPTTPELEKLAAEIGENAYIDVAKWRLLLSDAHVHTQVAEQVYPFLEAGTLNAAQLTQVLKGISVPLGGGQITASLADLVPSSVQSDLLKVLEDYRSQM